MKHRMCFYILAFCTSVLTGNDSSEKLLLMKHWIYVFKFGYLKIRLPAQQTNTNLVFSRYYTSHILLGAVTICMFISQWHDLSKQTFYGTSQNAHILEVYIAKARSYNTFCSIVQAMC